MNDSETARFWEKVNKNGPVPENRPDLGSCWIWTAGRNQRWGYGQFNFGSKRLGTLRKEAAHRLSYKQDIGAIPVGLILDHLCRTPACVRPSHLEPVTNKENVLRGESFAAINARKTHCAAGHPYDSATTYFLARHGYSRRICRICNAKAVRAYQRRLRGAA